MLHLTFSILLEYDFWHGISLVPKVGHTVIAVFSDLFSAADYLPAPVKLMMLHSMLTLIYDHQGTSPLPFCACTGFGKTPNIPRFLDIQEHILSTKKSLK